MVKILNSLNLPLSFFPGKNWIRKIPERSGSEISGIFDVRLGDSRIRQGDFKILPPKSKIATVALKIGISKKEKHFIITK